MAGIQEGYGDSGVPREGEVSAETQQAVAKENKGSVDAAASFDKEESVAVVDEGLVAYVAAAEYANSRWLVVPGKAIAAPITAGGTPGMIPLVRREGDIWAKFVNGVMVTEDLAVIAWCDERTDICRRTSDPMTKSWATLKSLQARLANRDRLLDTSELNADEAFPAGMVDHIAAQAAKSGSPGAKVVERAETTRQAMEAERAASS